MLDSTNPIKSAGFTVTELLIAVAVSGILAGVLLTFTFLSYGGTIQNSSEARLAVESQNILRSVVEELRVSSGVRATNSLNDPNAPGGAWTTSNSDLVLIISTPVTDNSNQYVIDPLTGGPYQNEIVYYAQGNTLYKRYLANSAASGNLFKTSCPEALASDTCPADVKLSEHFKNMSFVFYDQDDVETTTLASVRSIKLNIDMEQKSFGRTVSFNNSIRMTMRNSL